MEIAPVIKIKIMEFINSNLYTQKEKVNKLIKSEEA